MLTKATSVCVASVIRIFVLAQVSELDPTCWFPHIAWLSQCSLTYLN